MPIRLHLSSIDRFSAARKAFAVLALCATVLVPTELLGTATVGAAGPTTSILVPSNGASLSGTAATLDAGTSNATSVKFLLFGGSYGYAAPVICTATLSYYGWVCSWNTTTVPDGSYGLVSEASGPGGTAYSSGVGITVSNTLTTSVLVPATGATVGGNVILDASAQGTAPVTGVTFTATQGSTVDTVGTATATVYGWIAEWPSAAYGNGTWSIQSVATEVGGTTATSSPVPITLVTVADLVSSSTFPLTSGGICGLYPLLNTYSGVYPGSTSVGTVSLAADPCGGWSLSTDVGSVSGPVSGFAGMGDLWVLQVTSGTGLFTGTTGVTLYFGIFTGPNGTGPFTGDVSVSG